MYRHLVSVALAALLLASSSTAWAQGIARSFEQLQLLVRAGDTVTVRDARSVETTGRIAVLSPTVLTLAARGTTRDFSEKDVVAVRQRRSDSLSNGALWGLVIGAGLAGTLVAVDCSTEDCDPIVGIAIPFYGGLGAGIGVGVDALIRKTHVIFQRAGGSARLSPVPIVGRGRRGVALSFTY